MKTFVALKGPVAVISEIGVQEPMADLVSTGEAAIIVLKLLCHNDAVLPSIDKSCGLDGDGVRRNSHGWGNLLGFLEADAESVFRDGTNV